MDPTERTDADRPLPDRHGRRRGGPRRDHATTSSTERRPSPMAWTARQVAHHLADSEAMAYIRLRRLIAEDFP